MKTCNRSPRTCLLLRERRQPRFDNVAVLFVLVLFQHNQTYHQTSRTTDLLSFRKIVGVICVGKLNIGNDAKSSQQHSVCSCVFHAKQQNTHTMSRKKLRADVALLNGVYRQMSNIKLDDEELSFLLNNRRFTCHLADFPGAVMVWRDGAAEPEFIEGGTLTALLDRIHERNGHAAAAAAASGGGASSASSATNAANKPIASVRASAASTSSLQPSLGSSSTQSFVGDDDDELLLDASNEVPVAQARRDFNEVT